MHGAFIAGRGNLSERVSCSPFHADTPTMLTGCSKNVSVGSPDTLAGRFASDFCSRCHIAVTNASCSASTVGRIPLITRYCFSGQSQPVFHVGGRLPVMFIFAVVQSEPDVYVQEWIMPLPNGHTAHAVFPAWPLGQDRKFHLDCFQ